MYAFIPLFFCFYSTVFLFQKRGKQNAETRVLEVPTTGGGTFEETL